jgi:hypothetical protein
MQIRSRIKRLEAKVFPASKVKVWKQCEHPENAVSFYRDYPAKGCDDRRLVVKFHCEKCGFQDKLWRENSLTDEQRTYFYYLGQSSFWDVQQFEAEAANSGLLTYFFGKNTNRKKIHRHLRGFYIAIFMTP